MARLAVLAFALFNLTAAALAGPGHDHGPEAPTPAAAVPRLESVGSDVELVAVAEGHTLTIYLDRSDTNAPVNGATIEVMGDGITPATATAKGTGVYAIEAEWVDAPGTRALTFTVMAEGIADLLAGKLVVPDDADDHGDGAGWGSLFRLDLFLGALAIGLSGFFLAFAFRPVRLPDDAQAASDAPTAKRPVAKHVAGLVLMVAIAAAALPSSGFAHEGHDHEAPAAPAGAGGRAPVKLPSGEVYLPKPTQRLLGLRTAPAKLEDAHGTSELVGTVIADPAHEGRVQAPMDGQIELSDRGVVYVGKPVKAGDVLAQLAPAMPVYERGTLAQVTADVAGKLRIAEQKLARLTRISGDYIPQRDIDDTRTEIESLREQMEVLQPKNTERLQLVAPVSGIIALATVRPGQVVSARDTLFEIVDPAKLWIEAIGMARTDDASDVEHAVAVDSENHTIPLTFIGRAPALRQQALPLLFRVEDAHASLGIGSTVKVLIRHGVPVSGFVVPDAAVVRAPNGLAQVWIKVAPERFAPRPVSLAPLDGERVVVRSGLVAGDRVVVEAAELINQVR